MKWNWKDFRLKAWHFCMLFAILALSAWLFDPVENDNPLLEYESALTELTIHSLEDSIAADINFVLFQNDNCRSCHTMEANLNQFAQHHGANAGFYKLTIPEDDISWYDSFKISGIPSVLIFKDGKEINRVMGIVAVKNLELIYNRLVE